MKLHLGCGKIHIPGWVHVDLVAYPHVDLVCPLTAIPLGDNVAEVIYACHVLEHFGRDATQTVLREWFRLLCPGGILRLSVPDFAAIAQVYQQGCPLNSRYVLGLLHGRQDSVLNVHRKSFDFTSLSEELVQVGFVSPRRYSWRDTEHAGIDDISQAYWPHMDKEHGVQMSLNVEAVKP